MGMHPQVEATAAVADLTRRLEIAIHEADIGIWEWDLRTHEFFYSARARAAGGAWEAASLARILNRGLAAFGSDHADRLRVEVQDVQLSP